MIILLSHSTSYNYIVQRSFKNEESIGYYDDDDYGDVRSTYLIEVDITLENPPIIGWEDGIKVDIK
jgi:hypothetical protein